jgi:hypothetical protein
MQSLAMGDFGAGMRDVGADMAHVHADIRGAEPLDTPRRR